MNIKLKKLYVDGMICESCERRIEKSLKAVNGVKYVKASYKEAVLSIKYDLDLCNNKIINDILSENGYSIVSGKAKEDKNSEWLDVIGIILFALIILKLGNNSGAFNIGDALSNKVGYIALFGIGLLSSLHCVGMCGGIMMSQSIVINKGSKFESLKPALKYNLGRLISYTVLGGIVGGIGKVISLSLKGQSVISLFAAIFMVVMGFNMSGFKTFRNISVKLPWGGKCRRNNKGNTPFVVGLLNGFMPCGPLQAMQLYALASGSIISGATSMFFFALGTIPLMLGFGLIANSLSQKHSKTLAKVSGIIIIVLGVNMASNALSLMGVNIPIITGGYYSSSNGDDLSGAKAEIVDGKQVVRITANAYGYYPRTVYIQKNMPTEIIVEGERITSCNNEIIIPSMNIRKKLSAGENIITFTAGDEDINYSCWMGMKRGVLKVVDDLSTVEASEEDDIAVEGEIQFYGMPISKVETNRLIGMANIKDGAQKISVKSTKGDFEPAVIVAKDSSEIRISYNLENKDNDGEYTIVNETFTEVIGTFEVTNGKANIIIPKLEVGAYGVVKGNTLASILEVHSDIDTVDKELIRKKYF